MTILWCGGEDSDFLNGSYLETNTAIVTGYDRYCIRSLGTSYSNNFPNGNITSCWLSYRIKYSTTPGTSNKHCGICAPSLVKGIWLGTNSTTASKLSLYKYDGTTFTLLDTETGSSLSYSSFKIDMYISSYTASSNVKAYVNGTLVIDFTGDITISDVSNFGCIAIQGNNAFFLSQFIISTEDTRLLSLVSHYPNAAGDTSNWTGAYTDIDEETLSTSDVVYTSTENTEFQANLSALPSGSFIVIGGKLCYQITKSSTGLSIQDGIRTGTTTSLNSTKTISTFWEIKESLYQVNPVTSVFFTPAEINALQIAFKAVADA
jgi:hypothetical protein